MTAHQVMLRRLREFAFGRGWRVREGAYGAGTLFLLDSDEGQARVAAFPDRRILVLDGPPQLRAEILIWKATQMPAEARPSPRFEVRE